MAKTYSYSNGEFTFPGDGCQVQIARAMKNRYGNLFAEVSLLTPNGEAYLAQDYGEISSQKFRQALALSAAKRNAQIPLELEELLLQVYLALKDDTAIASPLPKPDFISAADFAKRPLPEVPELVEGLIAPGRLYVVGAKPKSGKTLLLMNLALAVAGGKDFLDRKTRAGRVAFFQLEDSERTLQRRFKTMAPLGPSQDLLLHLSPFRLAEENFEATAQAIRGCALVICDPVIQAGEIRDWNQPDEVRKGFDLWRRLARESDAAVILSAHHRKMEGDYGDALAGSVQAAATVDGLFELTRQRELEKAERRLSFLGRDWGEINDEVIRLDTNTLWWRKEGTYAEIREEARIEAEAARLQEKLDKVLAALPSGPPGLTYAELAEASGIARQILYEVIRQLGSGIAQEGKARSKTNPQRFWRIA